MCSWVYRGDSSGSMNFAILNVDFLAKNCYLSLVLLHVKTNKVDLLLPKLTPHYIIHNESLTT